MSKKYETIYKKVNTPIVTHMLNLMQWVYGDPHVRGAYDEISVNGEDKKVVPLFSAFQAFIISSAISMREPGQEKITTPTEEDVLKNLDRIIALIETFLKQPVRTSLVAGLDKFITNGEFEAKPLKDEEAEMLFGKKVH